MTRAKRLFDFVASVAGLVVLSPLFGAVAIAIRLGDGGPVFFRQVRMGKDGVPFRIWKFRTMVTDAERRGRQLTVGGDDRITPVGAWLRRYKLDELPQLLNVAAGEMSLVGPRPEVPRYVELYAPAQRRVLELVPGITDPASIEYRAENELLERSDDPERAYVDEIMPHKIQLNLEYADRATFWSDCAVLARTVRQILPSGTRAGS